MATKTLDLVGKRRIEQGTSFAITIRPSSNTLDFAGSTWAGQIKAKYSDVDPVATFNCVTADDSAGLYVSVTLTPAQTSAIVCGTADTYKKKSTFFCYDIECTLSDLTVIRCLEGAVEVSPEVTT
jgi:hypothetical protein